MNRYIDEHHEIAAALIFAVALLLELFADFDDFATLGTFALAAVTLLGSQRYAGMSFGGSRASARALEDDEEFDPHEHKD